MILGESVGAHHVPERRLARGGGDADAGRSAIHVIGDVDAFGMAGQRLDAARLGLGEQRMVGQTVVLQQGLQRARAAAESERIDRQHGDLGIDVIALVAGQLELALQRLAQDHPQRVAGRHAVARRQHELVAEGMLGAAIVVAQAAELRPGQMRPPHCRACRPAARRNGRSAHNCPAAPGSCRS